MRQVQATVTRLLPSNDGTYRERAQEQPVGIQVIAGVVTFQLEDGTLIEMDHSTLMGAMGYTAVGGP